MIVGNTNLKMIKGDSADLLISIVNDTKPVTAVDLSTSVSGLAARPAILRFSVKAAPAADTNSESLVLKYSYSEAEIAILSQTGTNVGKCVVYVDKSDTMDNEAGNYSWDLELTRQDMLRFSPAGTISVVAGSPMVVGSGTSFMNAKVGDVLQSLGVNAQPVIIKSVLSATSIELDYPMALTESGVTYEVRRGKSRTVARGAFTIVQDVVT